MAAKAACVGRKSKLSVTLQVGFKEIEASKALHQNWSQGTLYKLLRQIICYAPEKAVCITAANMTKESFKMGYKREQ